MPALSRLSYFSDVYSFRSHPVSRSFSCGQKLWLIHVECWKPLSFPTFQWVVSPLRTTDASWCSITGFFNSVIHCAEEVPQTVCSLWVMLLLLLMMLIMLMMFVWCVVVLQGAQVLVSRSFADFTSQVTFDIKVR